MHANADALSRRPCRQCGLCGTSSENQIDLSVRAVSILEIMATSTQQNDDPSTNNTDPKELQLSQQQEADPDIGPVVKLKMQSDEQPDISQMVAESADTKTLLHLKYVIAHFTGDGMVQKESLRSFKSWYQPRYGKIS